MYCSNCGAKIDDNARFCPECGKSVAGEPAPQRELAPLRQPSSSQPRVPEYTPEPTSTRRKNTSFKKPQFKKEGSGEGSKVFFKILAAAIVLLVAYLGYDYFANGVGGGDEVVKKTSKPYFKLNEEEESYAGNRSLAAPSDLSLISYFPTRNEIEAVEPIQVEVSSEHPICRIGDITVEFSPFEFDEFAQPDTFQLRQLGTRHDDASGRDLTLFDFSLKSGKHQFSSNVYVTLPRPANGNGVLYYNESTKSWEHASYSITDDLKNYILRTNHFSDFSLSEDRSLPSIAAIPSDMSAPSTGIAGGTIDPMTDQEKSDYFNDCIYYIAEKNQDKKKILTQSIGIDLDRFKATMISKFISASLLSEYLSSEDKEEIENSLAQGELFASMNLLKEENDYMSKYNSWQAIFEFFGKKAPEIPKEVTDPLGELHMRYRLLNAINKGDSDAIKGVIKDYFKNGFTEIRDKAAGTNLILRLLCACWDLYGEDFVKDVSAFIEYEPAQDFEFFYHKYMSDGINMGKYGILKLSGNGWEAATNKVIDDVLANGGGSKEVTLQMDALYREFLDRFFAVDENIRTKLVDDYLQKYDEWYRESIEYCKRCELYHQPYIMPEYAPNRYYGLPVPDSIRVYKQRAYEKLHYYTEKEISKAIKELPDKMCDNLYLQYVKNILPSLNTILKFRVRDTRLLNKSTFDKSPYNINGKIKFNGTKPLQQVPLGTMFSDFAGDVLNPYTEEDGSDIVFCCSRYYYMQMGSPTSITFSGTNDNKPITISFSVPTTSARTVFIDLKGDDESEDQKQPEGTAEDKVSKESPKNNASTSSAKKSFEIPSDFSASSVSGSHEEYGHKMKFSISGGYINPKEIVDDTSNDKIRHYDAYIKVGQTISVKAVNTQGYEDTGMEKWNSARCFMEVDGVGEGFIIDKESGATLPSASGSYVVQKGDRKIKAAANTGTTKWHPLGGVSVGVYVEVRYKVVE